MRGQVGATLEGQNLVGLGPEDAAAQADLALSNLAALLSKCGSGLDEVTKITVYVSDHAYRGAVYLQSRSARAVLMRAGVGAVPARYRSAPLTTALDLLATGAGAPAATQAILATSSAPPRFCAP